jgi:hypothetical protein
VDKKCAKSSLYGTKSLDFLYDALEIGKWFSTATVHDPLTESEVMCVLMCV